MAGKLISLNEAASMLGVSPDRLNELRQSNDIYGYRDGASWKFKQEDLERLKESLGGGGSGGGSGLNLGADLDFALPMDDEKDELMLAPSLSDPSLKPGSDVLLGGGPGKGMPGDSELTLGSADSDAKAGKSDVSLASDIVRGLMGSSELQTPKNPAPGGTTKMRAPSPPRHDDDEEFVLGAPSDVDLDLTGSKTILKSGSGLSGGLIGSGPIHLGGDNVLDSSAGGSSIGLGDERDNVLGGSGSGSDITHRPGDSGILLVDPADSGISLDAPPALSGSRLRATDATVDFDSGAEDDFLLKPLDEGGEEDSESGSQVIMLDTDQSFEEKSSTLIASSMPGLNDMDFGSGPLGGGLGVGMSSSQAPAAVIPPGMVVVPKEAPFGLFAIVGLTACTLMMVMGGVMMFDLVRNIWSWDAGNTTGFTSALMDSMLGR